MRSKPHILMIDDDVDFLQILTHLIDAMGYQLSTTTSANEGIEMASHSRVDLIFCDLRLHGEWDGFDFARKLHQREVLSKIPAIAITGYSDGHIIQQAHDAGFVEVFTKPVKFAQIKNAVEQHVKVAT